jgi:hypothetical protein
MSKVCNSDSHDQDAPNKHNLLCGYRSVLEVIQTTNPSSRPFLAPTTTIVQDRDEDDFIIIQDVTLNLDSWTLWRNSLAQMFIAMQPHGNFTLIRQEDGNTELTATTIAVNWYEGKGRLSINILFNAGR